MRKSNINKGMINTATAVIIHAGNARLLINKAVEAMENREYELVESFLQEADDEITEAHRIQTETLQAEARGDEVNISFLWIHAQDSLMSVVTEIRCFEMIKRLVKKEEI